MVASSCPYLAMLKPLVRFHLPFSTVKETIFRVISMYLLGQYFRAQKGEKPDWELKNLVTMYDKISLVNKYFCKRLKAATQEDASINGLIILDIFASVIRFSIDKNLLSELENLFSMY